MEALLTSVAVVALAEIGDKTQLLAIMLAARFRRPWPVVAGILVATLANHFLAALLGQQVSSIVDAPWFNYAIAASFIAMALWTLIPDKLDVAESRPARLGPFLATTLAFFCVEMGDKTQVATVVLGARFAEVLPVTMGTTLGMMIANVPAVWLGHALLTRIPMTLVRVLAALMLGAVGVALLVRTIGFG